MDRTGSSGLTTSVSGTVLEVAHVEEQQEEDADAGVDVDVEEVWSSRVQGTEQSVSDGEDLGLGGGGGGGARRVEHFGAGEEVDEEEVDEETGKHTLEDYSETLKRLKADRARAMASMEAELSSARKPMHQYLAEQRAFVRRQHKPAAERVSVERRVAAERRVADSLMESKVDHLRGRVAEIMEEVAKYSTRVKAEKRARRNVEKKLEAARIKHKKQIAHLQGDLEDERDRRMRLEGRLKRLTLELESEREHVVAEAKERFSAKLMRLERRHEDSLRALRAEFDQDARERAAQTDQQLAAKDHVIERQQHRVSELETDLQEALRKLSRAQVLDAPVSSKPRRRHKESSGGPPADDQLSITKHRLVELLRKEMRRTGELSSSLQKEKNKNKTLKRRLREMTRRLQMLELEHEASILRSEPAKPKPAKKKSDQTRRAERQLDLLEQKLARLEGMGHAMSTRMKSQAKLSASLMHSLDAKADEIDEHPVLGTFERFLEANSTFHGALAAREEEEIDNLPVRSSPSTGLVIHLHEGQDLSTGPLDLDDYLDPEDESLEDEEVVEEEAEEADEVEEEQPIEVEEEQPIEVEQVTEEELPVVELVQVVSMEEPGEPRVSPPLPHPRPAPRLVQADVEEGADDEAEEEEEEATYNLVLEELVSSETIYANNLEQLLASYVAPVKARHAELHLSEQDVQFMFSNLETINQFHALLKNDLACALDEPAGRDENTRIKDVVSVLRERAPFLRIYTQYVSSYDMCLSTIAEQKKNSHFRAFLREVRVEHKEKKLPALGLMAYLIMPVQRIPRYELLLRELLKQLPESRDDLAEARHVVGETLELVKSIAGKVNERKQHVEDMSKLLSLQNRVQGTDRMLMEPHRRLLHYNLVETRYASGGELLDPDGKSKVRVVVVFNDALMVLSRQYKFKHFFPLEQVELVRGSDEDLPNSFRVSVASPEQFEFLFSAHDARERDEWLAALNQALAKQAD